MSQSEGSETWVVYVMALRKHPDGMNAVCEQSEWEEIERRQPGLHRLVQGGITSEAVAERLARGVLGNAFRSGNKKKTL